MTLTNRLSVFFMAFIMVGFFSNAEAGKVKEFNKMRSELVDTVKGTAKKVGYELGEDEGGEYIRMTITGRLVDKLDPFEASTDGAASYVSLVEGDNGKVLQLTIYTSDLENWTPGTSLQTSEGREFPKFLGGDRFESLWGFNIKEGKIQLYVDPGYGIFGVYVNVEAVGKTISKVNEFKNKIPVLKDVIPNINSIPVGIKVKKQKVARIYALANDVNNERGGLLLLVDHARLKAAIKK